MGIIRFTFGCVRMLGSADDVGFGVVRGVICVWTRGWLRLSRLAILLS